MASGPRNPGPTPHGGGGRQVLKQFFEDYGWIILLILAILGWALFLFKSLGWF